MKQKFYYIDETGKKRKYVGAIQENADGTYTGYLTQDYKVVSEDVELTKVPAVAFVQGHASFFTYNSNGKEIRYTGWPHYNGVTYDFTYNEYIEKDLTFVPAVESKTEYYTYLDANSDEQLWLNKVEYDKITGKYFGKIKN